MQQRENRISKDDERFERSVTRLSSTEVAERLTALAGMKPFLLGSDRSRKVSALVYLVNAGVIETDPTVRSAVENLFDSLSELKIDADVLNEGLSAARDRNRAVFGRRSDAFLKEQSAAKTRLVSESYTEVQLGAPSSEDMAPLEISGKMIASFVRAGAHVQDLSGIYCPSCVFSSAEHPAAISGTSFEKAILRRAVFAGADLHGASFHNADLVLTSFVSSNLTSTKFTADTALEPWSISAAFNSGELANSWGAIFACSNLTNADFSGRMIFTLIYDNGIYGGNMRDEFNNALLTGTKFRAARFSIATPAPIGVNDVDTSQFLLPAELSPLENNSFSLLGGPVHYFKNTNVLLWQYFGTEENEFKSLPNSYGRDLILTMTGFATARDVEGAELPKHFKSFIEANRALLDKPLVIYDCSTGQKRADISGLFSQGGPMTGNVRF